jgi:isopentenyl-diphosphate delta-isomerase
MEERKKDHILLSALSQTEQADNRFYYEPLHGVHCEESPSKLFLGKSFDSPIWISSMTGGTEMAATINRNLATACAEFKLGMGLGSCRPLLESRKRWDDFNLRPLLGKDRPFYANLGIAQLEMLHQEGKLDEANRMLFDLDADGLIIHINPLQEWLQPEGDRFTRPSLETIEICLENLEYPVIVKEVGQGMGPESISALLNLPIAALDFGAFGGTNFSKLEWLRSEGTDRVFQEPFISVGHSPEFMLNAVNSFVNANERRAHFPEIIISGGIKSFLDGYYFVNVSTLNAVYGQASSFLHHAQGTYEKTREFVKAQVQGLAIAYQFLRPRQF